METYVDEGISETNGKENQCSAEEEKRESVEGEIQENGIDVGKNVLCNRDLIGYGENSFDPRWPNNAKIAVSFVVNYEEGAESCTLNGDRYSEHRLNELCTTAMPLEHERNLAIESLYEYGSRCGFWRLLRLFKKYCVPVTVYACALALQKNPQAGKAMLEAGWELASHGYRWLDYTKVDIETEREHIRKCAEIHAQLFAQRPMGFYQGKPSVNTRRLVAEEGGYIYDNDSYADDLPYWESVPCDNSNKQNYGEEGEKTKNAKCKPLLIIPYTLSVNDIKFVTAPGYSHAEDFYQNLKDTFDYLYEEGKQGKPKMMSVGLHGRLAGHPGRAMGLSRFIEYIKCKEDVWICRRIEIAEHWRKHFPPNAQKNIR